MPSTPNAFNDKKCSARVCWIHDAEMRRLIFPARQKLGHVISGVGGSRLRCLDAGVRVGLALGQRQLCVWRLAGRREFSEGARGVEHCGVALGNGRAWNLWHRRISRQTGLKCIGEQVARVCEIRRGSCRSTNLLTQLKVVQVSWARDVEDGVLERIGDGFGEFSAHALEAEARRVVGHRLSILGGRDYAEKVGVGSVPAIRGRDDALGRVAMREVAFV